jgi:hypothetical protein
MKKAPAGRLTAAQRFYHDALGGAWLLAGAGRAATVGERGSISLLGKAWRGGNRMNLKVRALGLAATALALWSCPAHTFCEPRRKRLRPLAIASKRGRRAVWSEWAMTLRWSWMPTTSGSAAPR